MVFTIKDIENLSGIKAHTIRIWEQRYSFLKPQRTDTNIRYYSNEELKTILTIALLNKYGYKISHIDKMSPETMAQNALLLTDAEARDEIVINELLHLMISYNIGEFEHQLNEHIAHAGLERSILKIIFPFLEKVGILWVTNHVNPAQEHLVSNIIRQKLIAGIDQLAMKPRSVVSVCLFLPEGEFHEISLLLVQYLLRRQGIRTIYLGAHTPLKELNAVVEHYTPDYLYTHLTSVPKGGGAEKFIQTLHKTFGNISTIISGKVARNKKFKFPPGVVYKQTVAEVREFIDQLAHHP